jgi:hypothetical protein
MTAQVAAHEKKQHEEIRQRVRTLRDLVTHYELPEIAGT